MIKWLSYLYLLLALTAAENHFIYEADATNAFGEAGAPKQGLPTYPDAASAFKDWYINCLGSDPIPKGSVVPFNVHEKHIDRILCKM